MLPAASGYPTILLGCLHSGDLTSAARRPEDGSGAIGPPYSGVPAAVSRAGFAMISQLEILPLAVLAGRDFSTALIRLLSEHGSRDRVDRRQIIGDELPVIA